MTRYWTAERLHEDADLLGLMMEKTEPHLSEEDTNIGDYTYVNQHDMEDAAYL